MGLSRKKVTVKGKNGKSFQRTMMVKSGGAAKRVRQSGNRSILVGKTGSGTAFKHGLAAGGIYNLSGGHRLGGLGVVGSVGMRAMSHVAAHQTLKKHGQQGKTIGQRVKHFLANEAGQMAGGIAGGLIHEGVRKLRHKMRS